MSDMECLSPDNHIGCSHDRDEIDRLDKRSECSECARVVRWWYDHSPFCSRHKPMSAAPVAWLELRSARDTWRVGVNSEQRVVDAPPFLKHMRRWHVDRVVEYCTHRRWQVGEVET